MSRQRIYMDYHATTPIDPRVLEAMMPYLTDRFGNASSKSHPFGWEAEEAVDLARKQTAELIHAEPREIIFTSGATESDNMAIRGVVDASGGKGKHVVTVVTEHKAVLDVVKSLEARGVCRATILSVSPNGMIDLEQLERAITPETILISVMFANNEIGVIQDIAAIGRLAKRRGVLFHTDAAQALGKESIDVAAMGIDLMSVSAHKMYGPKGVGALSIRAKDPRVKIEPLMEGGGQERGLRPGTLNVPGIVGFGKACEIARAEMAAERERLLRMRQRLWTGIREGLDGVTLHGDPDRRLAGNLNIGIDGVTGEALMMGLKDIAVSSGAACTSEHTEPSSVLRAIGVDEATARSSLRLGIGRFTTDEEIEVVVQRIVDVVSHLREKTKVLLQS